MFFMPADFQQSKYSMEHFKEWANEIASSYFNTGMLPTETLSKIAQSEDLTPHQIEVLAGEANKTIHSQKFASAEEKYFAADFPHADAKQVVDSLQLGETKTAGYFVDPKLPVSEPSDMFGVLVEELDKTAEVKHHLKFADAKNELLKQRLDDQVIIKTAQKQAAEKNFIKMAWSYCLEDSNSTERMKTLGHLNHFVKQSSELSSVGKKMLAKVAYVLTKEGKLEPRHSKIALEYFTKESDEKAPQELISENLNIQIVNGNHPLYITLKTIADNEADLARFGRDSKIVDDRVRILKQKIRAL